MTRCEHLEEAGLRYLSAARVETPAGMLSQVELRTPDDRQLGYFDGVLIDAAARRVRYFAVKAKRWLGSRRYLFPADQLAQLDSEHKTLRLRMRPDELDVSRAFDTSAVPEFSDEDLLTTMFQPRMA